jgi:phenylacetate-CoA ligase
MVDLYTRLVSGVIFPLQENLKGHDTVRVRREMDQSQWWPREKLEALQLARLQALLQDAYRNVPYYRAKLDEAGMAGGKIASLSDLGRVPLLSKQLIRANSERLKSTQARGLARFNTGGSSGEPLIFWIGKERVSHDVAAKWRATRWWGVDIGDPEIVVWGSPIELGAQDRLRVLRDAVFRTHLLPAFEMSPRKLDEFVDTLRTVRPRMVFGYPSSIGLIAEHAAKHGRRLDNLGTKVVFVTAERLYDHQRSAIERAFACPVANGYGGRDAGFIAHQCPDGGMHITAEDIIVEIVDGAGKVLPLGREGEVVVTHLATRDFPFIRYQTGDVAVLDERNCTCGRGLPLLKEVQGRTTDFVVASDGTIMHGLALIYVIRDIPGVENFRIVQESLQETRVQLVTGANFAEERVRQIEQGFKQRLGQDVNVRIEQVAQIPREPSGKHRYVVSRVAGVNH